VLANASRKVRVILHAMFYNFTRKQAALKMTPAMAAGITDRVLEMADLGEDFIS
jgi:hypothetical protein